MAGWSKILLRAGPPAVMGALTSTAALSLLAVREGRGALQPLNATSHWLNGVEAAKVRRADLLHTGVGAATHLAATFFWAVPFELWTRARRPLPPGTLLRDAAVVSAVAAAVDYLATPKRFTPGWEYVLSRRAMAAGYAAMALGLAAGSRIGGRRGAVRG